MVYSKTSIMIFSRVISTMWHTDYLPTQYVYIIDYQ